MGHPCRDDSSGYKATFSSLCLSHLLLQCAFSGIRKAHFSVMLDSCCEFRNACFVNDRGYHAASDIQRAACQTSLETEIGPTHHTHLQKLCLV